MAIQPNVNPESAAVLGQAWVNHDEDTFHADADSQRKLADAAATGAAAVQVAGQQTADTLQGKTGNVLQEKLGQDNQALGTAGDRHAEAATHLDAAALNIAEAKAAMNTVDADYHQQLTTMAARAAAEGWTPVEAATAKTDLLSQAQSMIANIRGGFDGAYEGVVNALTTASSDQAPKMAPGTVEMPPPGGTDAHQMGQAAGTAAVDFTSGMLSSATGQGGSPGAAAGMGAGYGVMAPGYGAPGGMGTGYGVMAPGMGAMMAPGMGMGGMMAPGMGGYGMGGAPTPLNQIGQAVGSIAQGFLSGQGGMGGQAGMAGQPGLGGQMGMTGQANLGGLAAQASISGQASLNGMLQQAGLHGGLGGAANAVAGLNTDLPAAHSASDVDKAISDAVDKVTADPTGAAASEGGDNAPAPEHDDKAAPTAEAGEETGHTPPTDPAADAPQGEDTSTPPTKEDGAIPTTPVSDHTTPSDPITHLQNGVNAAIDGAADSARHSVDGAATAMHAASNTSLGVVTAGADGAVHADTIGLQGPQHIDSIRTETSGADFSNRDASAAQSTTNTAASTPAAPPMTPTPAAPMAPYGSGAAVMTPPPSVPTQQGAAVVPAGTGGSGPAPRQTLSDIGRHRIDDATQSGGGHHPTSSGADIAAAATAAGVQFLALLRGPVAAAHTRLALIRTQQVTSNTVTASAIGVFETDTAVTYVLATAHGLSYLAVDGAIPSDTRLLSELVDDTFYGHWCGYSNPGSKLAAFATTDQPLGHLTYVLTTDYGVILPGIEVVTQSATDVQDLLAGNLLAATSRHRRDIVLEGDADLATAIREMAMRTKVLRGSQYLNALFAASGALWRDEADRALYLEQWLRVLSADAQRAVEQGKAPHAWFAVAEYRRAASLLAPQH